MLLNQLINLWLYHYWHHIIEYYHLKLEHNSSFTCPRLERAVKIIKLNVTSQFHLPDIINFSKIQTCLMAKKCLDNNICSNFVGHFEQSQHGKNTQNNNIGVKIPKTNFESRKKVFFYRGAIELNKLPRDIRVIESYMLFQTAITKHFMNI